jgi:hypothetical protein
VRLVAARLFIKHQLQQNLILAVPFKNKEHLVVVMIAVEMWKACKMLLMPA